MPRVIVGMEDGLLVTADAEEVENLEILTTPDEDDD